MTDVEPKEPYVYQPFGSVSNPTHAEAGRLWGIGGLHHLATVNGLTRDEADRVLTALKGPTAAQLQGKIDLLRNAARGGNADKTTAELIEFVADRLVDKYGENPKTDFIRACRERAAMLRQALGER